ncbi:MAG: YaaW family protein [Microcoleaceae cyanobacterium]
MDELRTALELASEDELEQLTHLLFSRRFNPLDYVNTPHPTDIQSLDRDACLDALETRFRYLAADGLTVLTGRSQQVTYRQVLLQVCRYLKLSCSRELSTTDLEAEIFLHLLERSWKHLPPAEQAALSRRVQTALEQSNLPQPLPLSMKQDVLSPLFKAGSAVAVGSVLRPIILKQFARQFALHFAKYQVARQSLVRGGAFATAQLQHHVTAQMAQRGMAMSAARYGATRSVFTFLGPMLWTWFLADVSWRTISTSYARIIPIIFTLAQIRLTRSEVAWEMV